MSLIATAVQHMIAAGMPAEAIVAAVADMEASIVRDPVAEKRRAYDRERKRNAKAESTGIPPESSESTESAERPLSRPPNEKNSNPPTHTPGNTTPRARKGDFPKPDWADGQVWADLLTNRKVKRLPCTATAHEKLLRDIAKLSAETGWPPGECLKACVGRGWGAIFDPREKSNDRGGQNIGSNTGQRDRRDGVARALDRQLGLGELPPDGYPTGPSGSDRSGPVAYLAAVR